MLTSSSRLKSNSMPCPSGNSRRNIRPWARSASLVATSTEKLRTPVEVTISNVCLSHAGASPPAKTAKAATMIRRRQRVTLQYRDKNTGGLGQINSSMRRRTVRTTVRLYFRRHQTLRPGPKFDQNRLARPQFGNAVAAQGLHMHEDVGRALAARQKTEAAQAVEPF